MLVYVAGFAFTKRENGVLLIRKNHPDWQAGRLNGVGGHVEDGEDPADAMVREFHEETGVDADAPWERFCVLDGPVENAEGVPFQVHMYRSTLTKEPTNPTDESCAFYDVQPLDPTVLPNLNWLIPLAHRRCSHDWPYLVYERSQEV